MIGRVTSNKMTGTVAVKVTRFVTHPLYKKRMLRSQKFLAQTGEKLNIGDEVEIKEVRPVSRRVNFAVARVIGRVEVLPEVKEEAPEKPEKKAPKAKPAQKVEAK